MACLRLTRAKLNEIYGPANSPRRVFVAGEIENVGRGKEGKIQNESEKVHARRRRGGGTIGFGKSPRLTYNEGEKETREEH